MDDLMGRYDWDAPRTARAEAILYTAMYDSLLTTWHEKFRYLRPRPALLETGLPTVILTPKHPSYPAGHGTYIGAGVTVLQEFFPDDRSEYEYLIPEVNNARVWAGVYFRDDMLAGNILGRRLPMRSWKKCIWMVRPVSEASASLANGWRHRLSSVMADRTITDTRYGWGQSFPFRASLSLHYALCWEPMP
jgi:hypothetical protein